MIDTLQVSRNLQNAGLSSQQADAIAQSLLEIPEMAELATKSDLLRLKVELVYWIVGAVGVGTVLQLAANLLRH